jgi:hypothetical protein
MTAAAAVIISSAHCIAVLMPLAFRTAFNTGMTRAGPTNPPTLSRGPTGNHRILLATALPPFLIAAKALHTDR